MSRISVCVTGVGGGGHGEQILKALRLAETPYDIVGTDMSPYSAGLGDVDHPHLLPPASAPGYLDELLGLCDKYNVRALFHGSEPELRVMSVNEERIRAQGILLPINPREVINRCMDKVQTFDLLSSLGFSVPRYARVTSLTSLDNFDIFPAVLKPSVGSGASANTFIVQDAAEMRFFANHMLSLCPEFIAQEYIGTPESEYTVGVLSDLDGVRIDSIAVRRYVLSSLGNRMKVPNRTSRPEFGPVLALSSGVSQGEIGRFPEVCGPCEEIARAIGARGPLNIQCRVADGRVYVFEINPRFSGTTSLRALVGFNEPDLLIRRHIMGKPNPERIDYKSGVIVRRLQEVLLEQRA